LFWWKIIIKEGLDEGEGELIKNKGNKNIQKNSTNNLSSWLPPALSSLETFDITIRNVSAVLGREDVEMSTRLLGGKMMTWKCQFLVPIFCVKFDGMMDSSDPNMHHCGIRHVRGIDIKHKVWGEGISYWGGDVFHCRTRIFIIIAMIVVCTGGGFSPQGVVNSVACASDAPMPTMGLHYDDHGKEDTGVNFVKHGGQ
jgi:hypothetical protein